MKKITCILLCLLLLFLSACGGFAAIAAAETSILGSILNYDPKAWKTLDLSEKQLAYFTNVALDDPDNPQNGEGVVVKDITDSSQVYDTGGTGFLATSHISCFLCTDINDRV